jgi:CRP-like cAMP-binding protein
MTELSLSPLIGRAVMSHIKHSRPAPYASPRDLLVSSGPGRNTKDYKANEKFYVQGETADSVFFIQQGRVKVTVTSEQGKVAVVGMLLEGQFFGEGCLHGQARRTATSVAMGDCRITSISKAAMLSAIRDQPEFGKLFMDHLLSRNGRIEEDVVTSFSIRVRSGSLACCCCLQTMERKITRPSFPLRSSKRRWRR